MGRESGRWHKHTRNKVDGMASLQLIQSVGDFQSKHNGLLRLVTHVFTSRICIACFDLSSCVITDGIDPSAL